MTETPKPIPGHQIELDGGRKVWAGEHDNSWLFRFDDGNGNQRYIRLSYEATEAMVKLVTKVPEEIYRFLLKLDPGLTEEQWVQVLSKEEV